MVLLLISRLHALRRATKRVFIASTLIGVLSACALTGSGTAPQPLDLGAGFSLPSGGVTAVGPAMPPIVVPAANAAALLTETLVVWRAGDQGQPQAYATYRWVAPPAQLVTQRIVERLSLQGAVLQQNVGGGLPQLRLNVQRFEQTFSTDGTSSQAQLTLQAVLMQDQTVMGQRLIDVRVPTATLDAPGGAQALRSATDQAAEQVAQWLTGLRNTASKP